MSVLDSLLSILAPHDCLSCSQEGRLLCLGCVTKLRPAFKNCYRCQSLNNAGNTCPACLAHTRLIRVQAAYAYQDAAKDIVWKLKSNGTRSAATEIAKLMAGKLHFSADTMLVPVPTASSRVRQRGYDQSKLLARALAKQLYLTYSDCLIRSGQAHQVGASRQTRLHQINKSFRVKNQATLMHQHIILIDDVTTTGATLEVAARALHQAGAKSIEAATFARA